LMEDSAGRMQNAWQRRFRPNMLCAVVTAGLALLLFAQTVGKISPSSPSISQPRAAFRPTSPVPPPTAPHQQLSLPQQATRTPQLNCPYASASINDYLDVVAPGLAVPPPINWGVEEEAWVSSHPFTFPSWGKWSDRPNPPAGMSQSEFRGLCIGPFALLQGVLYSLSNGVLALDPLGAKMLQTTKRLPTVHVDWSYTGNTAGGGMGWVGSNINAPTGTDMAYELARLRADIVTKASTAFAPAQFPAYCRNLQRQHNAWVWTSVLMPVCCCSRM
jgi:hypothetical protein